MSVTIPLSRGQFAVVDDEDAKLVMAMPYAWYAHKNEQSNTFYAFCAIPSKDTPNRQTLIRMHRLILGDFDSESIDHIDGNGLNNRRSNLRVCSHQQNMYNKKVYRNNKSGCPGVGFHKLVGKWYAEIKVAKKTRCLGYFEVLEDAIAARKNAEIEYFGDFAPSKAR